MNRFLIAASFVVCSMVPLFLVAQGAPPPQTPAPSPITSYIGRYVDSSNTSEWFDYPRTRRAEFIRDAPDIDRVLVRLGGSALGIYVRSTFSQHNTPTATSKHGELYSPPEVLVDAEDPASGWTTIRIDGRLRLTDFDWDRRGYIYMAYSIYGFGIVDLQGHRIVQLRDSQPGKVISFSNAGKWYVILLSSQSGAARLYDVTDPYHPQLISTPQLDFGSHAKTLRGDAIAILGPNRIRIYSPAALLNGTSPVELPVSAVDLATDGKSFFTLDFEGLVQAFGPDGSGGYIQQASYIVPAGCFHLSYGAGYLAVLGFDTQTSHPTGALLRFDGAAYAVSSISQFLSDSYGTVGFISPYAIQPFAAAGGTYAAFNLSSIGDIFALTPAIRPGTLQFAATSVRVNESAGAATLVVSRTEGSDGTVSIPYTITAGTASAGTDFQGTAGMITFAPGETSKSLAIPIIDDLTFENDETFTVSLGSPTAGALLGPDSDAIVTIANDDPAPAVNIASATVVESDGVAKFEVTLSNPSAFDIQVAYATADGSAHAGADYAATTGTLLFPAGSLTQEITVPIINDAVTEGDEMFSLTLSNPVGAALGNAQTATGTIIDDDADLAVTIDNPAATVATGSQFTYTVRLTNLGLGTAENAALSIPVPAGAALVSLVPTAGTCSAAATPLCTFAPLAPGSTVAIAVTVSAPSSRATLSLSAVATESGTDPAPANNTVSAGVLVIPAEEIPTLSEMMLLALAVACGVIAMSRLRS